MTSSCLLIYSHYKGRSFIRISRNPKCMSIVSSPHGSFLHVLSPSNVQKPVTGICVWLVPDKMALTPFTVYERKGIEPGRSRSMLNKLRVPWAPLNLCGRVDRYTRSTRARFKARLYQKLGACALGVEFPCKCKACFRRRRGARRH